MARVKKVLETKAGDWQTIFCSLSIILVAFFVMLSSYATPESGKIVEVKKSFEGALKIFTGGILFEKGEGVVAPSPDTSGATPEALIAPIQRLLRGEDLDQKISLQSTSEYVSVSLLASAVFYNATAEITPTSLPVLRRIAAVIGRFNVPVMVLGHTDDRPVRADQFVNNLELSTVRANTVAKILMVEGGLQAERLVSVGYGQHRPFVPNRTDEDRMRNNRVEIIIPLVADVLDAGSGILRTPPPSFKVWGIGD